MNDVTDCIPGVCVVITQFHIPMKLQHHWNQKRTNYTIYLMYWHHVIKYCNAIRNTREKGKGKGKGKVVPVSFSK